MTAVLSVGSNLGDRWAHLRAAVDVLSPQRVSSVYETAPWGGVDQDDFLNLVAICDCDAAEAWARAQRAEHEAGRTREVHWGPRTLDVDVVVADGSDPGLVLPHPHAHERAFVLVPWAELEPDAELPGHGRIAEIAVDRSAVRRIGEL